MLRDSARHLKSRCYLRRLKALFFCVILGCLTFYSVRTIRGRIVLHQARVLHARSVLKAPVGVADEEWNQVLSHYYEQGLCTAASLNSLNISYTYTASQLPRVIVVGSPRLTEVYVALRSLATYPYVTLVSTEQDQIPYFLKQCFPNVDFLNPTLYGHLPAAWNTAIRHSMTVHDFFVICNDDVIFPNDWLERLTKARAHHKHAVWLGLVQSIQFGAFGIPASTIENVGLFDEGYTAYFEDDDYWIRMEECYGILPGRRVVLVPDFAPAVIHRRVGWKNTGVKPKSKYARSKERFFQNWIEVNNCTSDLPCFRMRGGQRVRRSHTYPREVRGEACVE